MGLPDFQLIIQAVLYLTAVGTGLVVSIPVALTDSDFGGNCILYGKITWHNATNFKYTFGSIHACNFVIYVNVLTCILYALGMAVYYGYGVYRSTKDDTIGSQMWVMPFILSNCLALIVCFISACIISVGFGIWCQAIMSGTDVGAKIDSCVDGQKLNWNKTSGTTKTFYNFLSAAQAAAWAGFAVWVFQVGLSIVRFIRNRRLRSKDSGFPDTVADTTEIAKEDPTA